MHDTSHQAIRGAVVGLGASVIIMLVFAAFYFGSIFAPQ